MAYSRQHDWDEEYVQATQHGSRILQSASQSIARSHTLAVDTENTGHEVLSDLAQQRESLLRSRAHVADMQGTVQRSNRILSSMSRHVLYNKVLLILIIFLEAIILASLIYIKFIKKK